MSEDSTSATKTKLRRGFLRDLFVSASIGLLATVGYISFQTPERLQEHFPSISEKDAQHIRFDYGLFLGTSLTLLLMASRGYSRRDELAEEVDRLNKKLSL